MKTNDLYRRAAGTTMTQMLKEDNYAQVSVNKVFKHHGEKATSTIFSEITQLNDKDILKSFNPEQV